MRLHKPPQPLRITRRARFSTAARMRLIVRLQGLEIAAERERGPVQMHAATIGDQLAFSEGFRLSPLSGSAFFLREMPVIAACRIDQATCTLSTIGRFGKV